MANVAKEVRSSKGYNNMRNDKTSINTSTGGGLGIWSFFALMYMFTSDTVEPIGKLEFFWRTLAGPINFLPI